MRMRTHQPNTVTRQHSSPAYAKWKDQQTRNENTFVRTWNACEYVCMYTNVYECLECFVWRAPRPKIPCYENLKLF